MGNIVNIGPKGSKLDWDNWGKPITDAVNQLWILANPPTFRIYQQNDAPQNMANVTWQALSFDKEVYDTDNGHDLVINKSRYTCVTPGLWEFTGKISWDSNTVGRRQSRWLLNGATVVLGSETSQPPASSASAIPASTCQQRMAVGDYIELQGNQDSGGTRTTSYLNDGFTSYMAGRLIAL